MHDVAFGLDPHVSHVALCEQQQPLSGDVVFFEEVGVNLHAQRALPWDGAQRPQISHHPQKNKMPDKFKKRSHTVPSPNICCIQKY